MSTSSFRRLLYSRSAAAAVISLTAGGGGLITAPSSSCHDSSTKANVPITSTAQRLVQVKREVDGVYSAYMKMNNIPGLSYAIVDEKGSVVLSNSLGLQSVEKAEKVTSETRFRIASMSKSFTAVAILQLRDAGKLRLDDPVSKYVPELVHGGKGPQLTIRHLLTMKAGLPQDDPWADRLLDQDPEEFKLFLSRSITHSNTIGIEFEYSNLAYAILGLVISNVAGVPYQSYITNNVLVPLGMTKSTFNYLDVPTNHLARGYHYSPSVATREEAGGTGEREGTDREGQPDGHLRQTSSSSGWQPEPILGDGSYGAMGGLISTIDDYAKYIHWHLLAWDNGGDDGTSVLSQESRREMHLPQTFVGLVVNEKHPIALTPLPLPLSDGSASTSRVAGYGCGLMWNRDSRGVTFVRHSGGLPGYGSEFRFLPQHGVGIVSFANKTYANMAAPNTVAMDLLLAKGIINVNVKLNAADTSDDSKANVSAVLRQRGAQLAKVISSGFDLQTAPDPSQDGTDTWGASLFASNFFLDRPLPQWERHCRAQTDRLQPITAISPVTAGSGNNHLRGSFVLTGHLGDKVRVSFTLSPEPQPKVQEVTLTYLGFTP